MKVEFEVSGASPEQVRVRAMDRALGFFGGDATPTIRIGTGTPEARVGEGDAVWWRFTVTAEADT